MTALSGTIVNEARLNSLNNPTAIQWWLHYLAHTRAERIIQLTDSLIGGITWIHCEDHEHATWLTAHINTIAGHPVAAPVTTQPGQPIPRTPLARIGAAMNTNIRIEETP